MIISISKGRCTISFKIEEIKLSNYITNLDSNIIDEEKEKLR